MHDDPPIDGTDIEWFKATGNCGHCGCPGDQCVCTREDPCSCRRLHRMGSKFTPEPEPIPEPIPIESIPLFGGD